MTYSAFIEEMCAPKPLHRPKKTIKKARTKPVLDSSLAQSVADQRVPPMDSDALVEWKNRQIDTAKLMVEMGRDNLPIDPRNWTRSDVENWLVGMSSKHSIPEIKTERFLMNGKALCLMSIEMYLMRVPLGGKMLYRDFQIRLARALYIEGTRKLNKTA